MFAIRTPIEAIPNRSMSVYRCRVPALDKVKLVVPVASVNASWACLLINSNRTRAQESLERLQPCQVLLPVATHPFLDWDSYVIVGDPFYLPDGHLSNGVGRLNGTCRAALVRAIRTCPVLKRKTRHLLVSALGR